MAKKAAIAPWANTGAYYFTSQVLHAMLAGKVLDGEDSATLCVEFYMSSLYCDSDCSVTGS